MRRFADAILAGGLLLALCATTACQRAVPAAEAFDRVEPGTNVVFVLVDTLRPDWTTPYGFEKDTTPELARWASEGALFENTLAQSSWTKMSMASLMTSLWPQRHGIRRAEDGLGDGAVTLAEVLTDAGYHSYGVVTNGWLHQSFGFHQGFERYTFPFADRAKLPRSNVWPHVDRVLEEAARQLDAHPEDDPFFLYLHFMDVHEYAAPREFQIYGTGLRDSYLNSVHWVDDGMRRLREMLEDRGLWNETLVVFGSDHGETFGEDGKFGHARNVLSTVLHVPLIIRLPDPIEPVRVATRTRNLDIAPTILDILGIPAPDSFEGRSLVPLMLDPSAGGRGDEAPTSFAALGQPLYKDASIQNSLNNGAWTYVRNVDPDPDPREMLFDLSVDPGEDVDLSARELEALERMRAVMDEHLSAEPLSGVLKGSVHIDENIAERLRAMGYLQ